METFQCDLEEVVSCWRLQRRLNNKEWYKPLLKIYVHAAFNSADDDVCPCDPEDTAGNYALMHREARQKALLRIGAHLRELDDLLCYEGEDLERRYQKLLELEQKRRELPFYKFRLRAELQRQIATYAKVDGFEVLKLILVDYLQKGIGRYSDFYTVVRTMARECYN